MDYIIGKHNYLWADMKISLIIPAFNEEKEIGACLKSALKNAPKNLLEIIVVDNTSTDGTAEIAKKVSPIIRVVKEPNKGLTWARQRGFIKAKGDILAYVDADTRMPESWFKILNESFSKHKIVCLSGPYYYYDLEEWQRAAIKTAYNATFQPAYKLTKALIIGGNFAVKREALVKIEGFDTSIPFYGEDTNLARRLKKVGKILFLKEFYINTSGRRFVEEGFFNIGTRYILNYVWEMVFKKPLNKKYKDVRN